ncbi:hypothetical protein N781_08640 [Pontibacillus halophilus JSM 076056 = DSM 19796]|uniref:UDP-N-acetylenolpyruvoylglucosamine reductase n=1 Tax=Pontibacillus halophilus JSM 076056 = DSM 19796 TaxID=1385510 RepID=A0A0A5GFW0_9BACI|nr:YaaR family protein [Pontibacillus halophilus]KGX90103.1 hypothetical protein N781_08640 [Pontibacillus halophilus JSM 076056 = DSM 19796]
MKIAQDLRTQMETGQANTKRATPSTKQFGSMVQVQTNQLRQEELNRLLDHVTKQGEKLARFRSFQDLAKYKRLVKSFLEETVQHGVSLKQSQSFNMYGQSRKMTVVEAIDEKLTELTDSLMEQEKKSIDLLGIIGEIKGLLVNLYT